MRDVGMGGRGRGYGMGSYDCPRGAGRGAGLGCQRGFGRGFKQFDADTETPAAREKEILQSRKSMLKRHIDDIDARLETL